MSVPAAAGRAVVEGLRADVFRIPTEQLEADGTLEWDSTTALVVHASGADAAGLGYSYTAAAAAGLVSELLEAEVIGWPIEDVAGAWQRMVRRVRNIGLPGLAATAISAVDVALWDLRARHWDMPLYRLLGSRRDGVPIYGSGGFTSYDEQQLCRQLSSWIGRGMKRVKMKVGLAGGGQPEEDVRRVARVREAIGPQAELFVDANGAYDAKQAVNQAEHFARHGVTYFEEPVSSDHLEQLAEVRRQATQAVAAGEYGYAPWYFRRMLEADAVDILQADATRCLGITGFLAAGQLASAYGLPFSAHTAPSVHLHAACAVPRIDHVEWFHDHARLETMLFAGVAQPDGDQLRPRGDTPGLGLVLRPEAARWQVLAA